ncbi:MAG: protein kinase [Acidimicrobiia bacterium]|nr:protein kinase [Acidimicrobiia bacterium]
MTLELTVLGPIGCQRAGEPVAIGGPQQRRLLAALLAEAGRIVPLERVVEAVWTDVPPDGAHSTARTYVSRLRSALGERLIETVEPGYRLVLGAGVRFDAAEFEALVARARKAPPSQAVSILDDALGLWQGAAYGEFATEWWALPEATRLEELRLVAIEERIEALLTVGDTARAISDLEGLVSRYPLRERLVGQLMRAYVEADRQAEALRTFQAHREYLADETGLDPSPSLLDLEQSIIGGDGRPPHGRDRALRGYVLEQVLGEGAFGTVYRSVQPGIDREVAVKVIRAELAGDPEFVRRFEAEAQLVAHLEHPHIVPLYDFWREPGGAYLVFRLLRGGSVEDLLAGEGALDLERVTRLVEEVGSALVAAHAAGIVHRDVKPSNILFDDIGNAYLVDFGIASGDRSPGLALPSAGSPLYAPPEQFHTHEPDPLTDQYSLAAVVYELLCGEPPFTGDSASTILRTKLEQPLPSLREKRPGLPSGLDAVLRRATASEPGERYESIVDMLAAWQRAVRSGTTTEGSVGGDGARAPGLAPVASSATMASLGSALSNPYIGLRAFGEADVRNFRGRSELTDELTAAVTAQGFVAVVGPSGSGKSSLIHAGLVPRLRAMGDRVATMVPGDDPLAQLRLALLGVALHEPQRAEPAEVVRTVAKEADSALTLVVDQLEELWTLSPDDDRRVFLSALRTLVESSDETTPVRVVAGVRADFFDRPLADPDLGPLVGARTFPVVPMTAAELHDAVTGPAASVGVTFEAGLDSEIVADVVDEPASLPLLQFTLSELFERRTGAVIMREAYRRLGGIAGAIGSRAEALYAGLSPQNAARARLLMLRLVVPGDGTEDTRRRVRLGELPLGAGPIVERFADGRLLVGDHDPRTREPTIEVAHESLLRSWPRLQRWLQDDRDALRAVQHLFVATRAWEESNRAESELYRGARLEVASALLESHTEQLTRSEREFVEVSAQRAAADVERDRRSRQRLRRLLAGTAVALVVALLAGGVALVQRRDAQHNAEDADVARLVSLSQSLAASKRDVAALLAIEASRRDPGAATDGALMTALYSDPTFGGDLRTGGSSAGKLAVSPDGRTMFSVPQTADGAVWRIDLSTRHASEVRIPGQGHLGIYQFQPVDRRRALVVLWNGTDDAALHRLELVDLVDHHIVKTADMGTFEPDDLVLSPDGTKVMAPMEVAYRFNPRMPHLARTVVYSLPDLRPLASLDLPGPPVDQDQFFPFSTWLDDDRIAVAGPDESVRIWRPSTDQVLSHFNQPSSDHWTYGQKLRVTSDGTTLVSGGTSGLLAFDLSTGKRRWARAEPGPGENPAVNFVIDDRGGAAYLQEAGFGSSRMIGYDLKTGETTGRRLDSQHGTACDSATTPSGTLLAVSSCNDGAIALWSLDGASVTGPSLGGPGRQTDFDAWSPSGHELLTYGDDDPDPEIADSRTGRSRPIRYEGGVPEGIIRFRSDGTLIGLSYSTDEITTYDTDGERRSSFHVDLPDSVEAWAWNDRAGLLAVSDGVDRPDDEQHGVVKIIDVRARRLVTTIKTEVGHVHGVALSPDGHRLYAAGQSELGAEFAVRSGKRLGRIKGIASVALSPDGRLLAGSEFSGLIRFFDAKTLQPVGEDLSGPTAFSPNLLFTPDSRLLLTSSLDHTLRVWDIASRRQIGPDLAIDNGVTVAPDGEEVAFSTPYGVGRLALDRTTLRRAACRSAQRELTTAEWRRYIGGSRHDLCGTGAR